MTHDETGTSVVPDIGIVTISFNQGAFLGQAMASVLATSVSVEYVLVDAGSTDGSKQLIERQRDKLAAVIIEPDQGPADGLNKGMRHISSPVVGYLNADDFYLPGALKEVVEYFAQHPDVDVALGHSLLVDASGRTIRRLRATSFTPSRFSRGSSVVVQQSSFFRRAAFERAGGFNIGNRTCWDAELLMDMALTGSCVREVDRYWGAFRAHEDSITVSGRLRDQYVADHIRLMRKGLERDPNSWDRSLARFGRVEKWIRHPSTLAVAIIDRLPRRP